MEKIIINENDVLSKYNELKNIHKVAKHFKVSISPIKRILKYSGIELSNRRYYVNVNFFDNIDSEIKAYWLGFLFADGYIRERKSGKSLELKLSYKDKKHIELFRKTIKSNHRIIDGFNNVNYKGGISKSRMLHLAIYSSILVNSIKTKGIHSRKTFTITKPDISKNLIPHFIRGYFDGDGSFSFNHNKSKYVTNFACASEEFRNFLISELNVNDIDINWYGGIKLYIQNKMDNLKFYNYIYQNATIFLERKKEKYEEFRRHYW
jgi:intein/homing endonuclease